MPVSMNGQKKTRRSGGMTGAMGGKAKGAQSGMVRVGVGETGGLKYTNPSGQDVLRMNNIAGTG
jgi:hypothetical protein